MVVSRLTWPRDVNSDLFGCVGRPFCQEATLVSNSREVMEERHEPLLRVMRACRELPLNSASIRRPSLCTAVVHFLPKCFGGQRQSPPEQSFLLPQ